MDSNIQFPAVIDLNVGGRHLTTSLSTLTQYPDSMLAAMFSGRQPVSTDKDGRYFIDVDGGVFVHVLNFLRFETMPPPEAAADVRKYADYFGLDVLKEGIISNIQDNGETLYGIWRSNCLSKVTSYTQCWEEVKRQLKQLDFSIMRICVRPYIQSCACLDNGPDGYSLIEPRLTFDCSYATGRSVLNLLTHDIQRLGIFIFEKNISCRCGRDVGALFQIK